MLRSISWERATAVAAKVGRFRTLFSMLPSAIGFREESTVKTVPMRISDIVVIDPVTCGYGVLIDQAAAAEFFGIDQDAAAMALVAAIWQRSPVRR